jgi:hypothetical protein
MDVGGLEVDPDGELHAIRQEPRRRHLPRRRKFPNRWSEDEIRDAVRVCYLGRKDGLNRAAIVLHAPEHWFPRRMVRATKRRSGYFPEYDWWGLVWDEQMWANVQMGDEPIDLVECRWPHVTDSDARGEARAWAGESTRDLSYFELPQAARSTLLYAFRRGPGYFFG